MQYIYLHGFASGPGSAKAQYFSQRFQEIGVPLWIPDLNQDDFSHLTFSRQLGQVEANLEPSGTIVIGSSFGGLTAIWLAERHPSICRVVLLAPALQFVSYWAKVLGEPALQQWQQMQYRPVYHYGQGCELPLHYQFVEDLQQYADQALQRSLPTLLIHGTADETIPVQLSRDFAAQRPQVKFLEVASDHSLTHVLPELWPTIATFCGLF